jgi:hypothetical protein
VPRYADRMLADGERVALRARQHWLAPLVRGRTAWAILIAAVVLLALNSNLNQGAARDIFGWFAFALLAISLLWLTQVFMAWYSEDYLVTNRRVLKVEGILKKRSADSSLEKINDAVLEQSVFGRMLGYGDLDILTAAETSVDQYRMLAQAQTFKRAMLDEKRRLEEEVYQLPGPPLRAAPEPAAAPAAASTAASNGPRHLSSDEITKALGSLADLRDRGAISAEEYDAKKQDLLGRL